MESERGQEHCGNSEEREFLSPRGNPGGLPEEGDPQLGLPEKLWQLHLRRKGNVLSEVNTGQSGSKCYLSRHLPGKYAGQRLQVLYWTCPLREIMLSHLPASTPAVSSAWNILSLSPHSRMLFTIHPPLLSLGALFLKSLPWSSKMDEISLPTRVPTPVVISQHPHHSHLFCCSSIPLICKCSERRSGWSMCVDPEPSKELYL